MKKSFVFLFLSSLILSSCTMSSTKENESIETLDDKDLKSIEVTTDPNKNEYFVGEYFDPTGMVVTGYYKGGKTQEITDYTYQTTPLIANQETVEISYKAKKTTVDIIVSRQSEEDLEEYTATIKFCSPDFNSVATAAGVQMDDSTYKDNADKLRNYIDAQLAYLNLVNSISCAKLNTAEYNGTTYLCVGTGYYLNDKYTEGSLVWNSEVKIYHVELKAMTYVKINDYSGNIVDRLGVIHLDDVNGSVEVPEGDTPKTTTISKDYVSGVNSFTISSTGGRVLLSEITITWRG